MKYIVNNSIIRTNGKDFVTMEVRQKPYTDKAKEVDDITGEFIRDIPADLWLELSHMVCFSEDEENRYNTIMISDWNVCNHAIKLFEALGRNVTLTHKSDFLYLTDGIEIAVPIGTTTQIKDYYNIDTKLFSYYINAAQVLNADTIHIVDNKRFIKMVCGDVKHAYRMAIKK